MNWDNQRKAMNHEMLREDHTFSISNLSGNRAHEDFNRSLTRRNSLDLRMEEKRRENTSLPVVSTRLRRTRKSYSEIELGRSILLPKTTKGTFWRSSVAKSSYGFEWMMKNRTASSFLASGNLSLSAASTMKTIPLTLGKYCFHKVLANERNQTKCIELQYQLRDHLNRRLWIWCYQWRAPQRLDRMRRGSNYKNTRVKSRLMNG